MISLEVDAYFFKGKREHQIKSLLEQLQRARSKITTMIKTKRRYEWAKLILTAILSFVGPVLLLLTITARACVGYDMLSQPTRRVVQSEPN